MDMTPNLNLPIPNADAVPATKISEEFPRLADALMMLDAIIFALQGAVAGKAAADHTQAISTIIGLTEALAAKMPANTTFSLDSLTDVQGAADALVNYVLVKKANGQWEPSSALAALGEHGHLISEITGLVDALMSKGGLAENQTWTGQNIFTGQIRMPNNSRVVGAGNAGNSASYLGYYGVDGVRIGYTGCGAADPHMRVVSDGGKVILNGTEIDHNNKKATNVAAAVADGDAVNLGQLKTQSPISMAKSPPRLVWVNNTTVTVKADRCRDELNAVNLIIPADINYNLPSPVASTHYHVLVGYDAGGAVAVTTQNSNTHSLPAGWQAYRRIGSIFTNASSQIRKFLQTGDEFLFDDSIYELDASAFSTSAALTTINVPPNCLARLRGTLNTGAGTSSDTDMIIVTCPDQVARAPTFKDFSFGVLGSSGGYACNDFEVFTDSARRIRRQASNGTKPARLITLGYNDRRGRDL